MKCANPCPVTTGALLFGGDWACAHGNVEALSHVATQLAARVDDPFRRELVELSALCNRDYERAAETWPALRKRLHA